MKAFITHTDYTLMSAVMTKRQYYGNEPIDLYVLMQQRNSQELLDAVRGEFANVYEIEPYINQRRFIWLLQRKKYFDHYEKQVPSITYDEVFVGMWDKAVYIARHITTRKTMFHFVEEGSVVYSDNNKVTKRSLQSELLNVLIAVFHYYRPFYFLKNHLDKMFVFDTALVAAHSNSSIKPISFTKIPLVVDLTDYLNNDVWILGSSSGGGLGLDNALYKPHPLLVNQLPLEIVYSFLPKKVLEKKIIVANASTSLLTPKMLFDVEPHILSTHCFESSYDSLNKVALFGKIYSIYLNKERCLAPSNLEELKELLEKIAGEEHEKNV